MDPFVSSLFRNTVNFLTKSETTDNICYYAGALCLMNLIKLQQWYFFDYIWEFCSGYAYAQAIEFSWW